MCHDLWESVARGDVAPEADLIVTMATTSLPGGTEIVPPGLEEWVSGLEDAGRDVLLIRDVPRFEINIFACGQQYGLADSSCEVVLDPHWVAPVPLESGFQSVIDVTDQVCPNYVCAPAIDGLIAYVDSHHISTALAEELTAEVDRQAAGHVSWWREIP